MKLANNRPDTWLNHIDSQTRYDKKGNPKTWQNIKRNTREAIEQIGTALTSPLWVPFNTLMFALNPEKPKGGFFKFVGAMIGGAVYSLVAGLKNLVFTNAAHASFAGAHALLGTPSKK